MANRSHIEVDIQVVEYRKMIRTVLKGEMKAIAKPILRKLRAVLPVKTGNLKRNVKCRYDLKSEGLRLGYSGKGFYGGILEEGTEHIQAGNYMKDVVEQEAPDIQQKIGEALDKIRSM